ncbi:MAG: thiamine-phosphate kinase, partial [Alphaproteobacteria bacterium]|nr:thiamine-phosphate kinase [Alphaproteobacteria bacterium]
MTRRRRCGEFEGIARYFAPLARAYPLAFGLRDDAALLRLRAGEDAVVTSDAMVAGVHFFPDDAPGLVAAKLLRTNLSDLAAKGARAIGYQLVTAWSAETDENWMAAFARGLAGEQRRYAIALMGGDTVATPGPASFAITAIGRVRRGAMIRRSGARAGHDIYVSGHIGDAHLGLLLRRRDFRLDRDKVSARYLLRRHQLPEPRLVLGRALVGLASAAVDVSDGLLADLGHICEASGVGARVELMALPISRQALRAMAVAPATRLALASGGDDYEICFTAPRAARERIVRLSARLGLPLTRIGAVTRGTGVEAIGADGRAIPVNQTG